VTDRQTDGDGRNKADRRVLRRRVNAPENCDFASDGNKTWTRKPWRKNKLFDPRQYTLGCAILSSIACILPAQSIFHYSITPPVLFGEEHKAWSSHHAVFSSPLLLLSPYAQILSIPEHCQPMFLPDQNTLLGRLQTADVLHAGSFPPHQTATLSTAALEIRATFMWQERKDSQLQRWNILRKS